MHRDGGRAIGSALQAVENEQVLAVLTFRSRDTVPNQGDAAHWTAYGLSRDIPLKDIASGRYLLTVAAKVRGTANPVVRETLITVQ